MNNALTVLIQETMIITQLRKVASVLNWDRETSMPANSGKARADQISLILSLAHTRFTGADFRKSLGNLIDLDSGIIRNGDLLPDQAKMVSLTWLDWHRAIALPAEFVSQLAQLTSEAHGMWLLAREKNRFDLFAPYLVRIVEMKRREADYLGYDDEPYDALLANYEPDITTADLLHLFDQLRPTLVALVRRIGDSKVDDHRHLLQQQFDLQLQEAFGLQVLQDMGYDMSRGRQDQSAHPFTTNFHPSDVRITTRLSETQLAMGLFGSIHEGGHALYEQGMDEKYFGTPLCEAVSLGFHESQSRLWENYVARSLPFWEYYYPLLQGIFPKQLANVELSNFYKAVNAVTPSTIRVEADEVTYNLHVMVRFDLERDLINGDLQVKDLREEWNRRMQELLGIAPPNDTEGVLQDIHWSLGALGYFPTYTLGNLYGRQIFDVARSQITDFDNRLANGDLKSLREWLRQNIHRVGRAISAENLIKSISNEALSARPFINYLETKYSEIYQL